MEQQDLKYPDWQEPLRQAIRRRQGFLEVETVIREKLRSLLGEVQREEERQALMDALTLLRLTKRRP